MEKKRSFHGQSLWESKLLKVMKLTGLLMLISLMGVFASETYSQTTRLTLNANKMSLEDFLVNIENQSEFRFFYTGKIDVEQEVSGEFRNKKIFDILDEIKDEAGFQYEVLGRQIILSPNDAENAIKSIQQQKSVSGKVTEGSNQPLPGVTVVVKGTTNGTVTNSEGNYVLSNIPENAILQFSFMGMSMQEITVGNQTSINLTMTDSAIGIEEVVAIGYGTIKKSDLTGAVSSVNVGDLQQTPMISIDQGLIGRASGVQVTQTSGMPGAVASIRIRGSSSIQGGNEPLYVIDGFPVYSGGGFGNTGGRAQLSGLSTVNPNDIESIEILKDAAATAIYGARAANGVILITTKTGKKGSDVITFEANYGVQNIAKKMDVMDVQNYAVLVNEAYTNDKLTAPYDAAKLAEISKLGSGTDWQDEIFRVGSTQNYQLTISGGDNKTTYAISGNYFDQQGIIINSDFKRYSTRLNFDRIISDVFKTGTHLSISHTINNAVATDTGGEGGVVSGAIKINPILPVYKDPVNGIYTDVNTPGNLLPNPFATAKEQIFNNATSRLLGNIYGEWKIVEGLIARVSVGADVIYNKSNNYTPSFLYQANGKSTATVGVNSSINWLNENTINWVKTFNNIHSLNVLGGFTLQQNNAEYVMASSSSFVNDVMTYNNLGAGALWNQPGSSAIQWNLMSYLARINYSLMNRYLFSIIHQTG